MERPYMWDVKLPTVSLRVLGGYSSMPTTKAQQRAVHKYIKANYDRQEVTFPKGKKDIIKAHAAARGESVNAFINRAVDETMERDNT